MEESVTLLQWLMAAVARGSWLVLYRAEKVAEILMRLMLNVP